MVTKYNKHIKTIHLNPEEKQILTIVSGKLGVSTSDFMRLTSLKEARLLLNDLNVPSNSMDAT